MNLERLATSEYKSATYRFEADDDLTAALEPLELEPHEIRAFASQFKLPVQAISANERVKSHFNRPRHSFLSRFSDGSFPVLYTALEATTAQAEVAHWFRKLYVGAFPRAAYYRRMQCDFSGRLVDLRRELDANPYLVSSGEEGYPSCIAVTRQALSVNLDGFLTPSARMPEGTCLPVLRANAVQAAQWDGEYQFLFDSEAHFPTLTLVD